MKKKILFLISSMQGGGAERIAAVLSNDWVGKGYQVTLVPTFSGRGECIYPLDAQVQLEYLADRVGTLKKNPYTIFKRFLAVRRMVKEYQPDVVVSFLSNVNVAVILATLGLNVRVVVSERTYPPANPLGMFLEALRKITYPLADLVVMQTQQGLQWLKHCCPRAQGIVIANPVVYPLPIIEPVISPKTIVKESDMVLLAVGRLGPEKGFDILLRAFASLVKQFGGWKLVVVGEGGERSRLEALSEILRLGDRVSFPGQVGNLADWYRRADIYVMSSYFEGFPNSLMEAMAYGLPVISFDCDTGPREIIRHGVDGILISPDAGESGLANELSNLMSDVSQRERLAESAIEVSERFSIERISQRWEACMGFADEY